jgi:hypothetical protein
MPQNNWTRGLHSRIFEVPMLIPRFENDPLKYVIGKANMILTPLFMEQPVKKDIL